MSSDRIGKDPFSERQLKFLASTVAYVNVLAAASNTVTDPEKIRDRLVAKEPTIAKTSKNLAQLSQLVRDLDKQLDTSSNHLRPLSTMQFRALLDVPSQ